MSSNPTQYYGQDESSMNKFQRYGGTGKYNLVEAVPSGSVGSYVTGSAPVAVMTTTGTTGTMDLQLGGQIDLADLTVGEIYQFGPVTITPTAGSVYALFPGTRGVI